MILCLFNLLLKEKGIFMYLNSRTQVINFTGRKSSNIEFINYKAFDRIALVCPGMWPVSYLCLSSLYIFPLVRVCFCLRCRVSFFLQFSNIDCLLLFSPMCTTYLLPWWRCTFFYYFRCEKLVRRIGRKNARLR